MLMGSCIQSIVAAGLGGVPDSKGIPQPGHPFISGDQETEWQELEVRLVCTSTREVLPPNSGAKPSPTSSTSCFQYFPYVTLSVLVVKRKDKESVFTNGFVLFSS